MITPTCLYTYGRVYWVLSMGCIHRTQNLAHVVLLSVLSSSHSSVRLSALTIYQYIQYSVSTCHKLVIDPVSSEISTSRSNYYTCFCACLVMFYFSFTLSYMLRTFQVLTHTCAIFAWCRFRFSASRSHIDRFPDLQFSRFSGESSFSQDNNHEFIQFSFSHYFDFLLDLAGGLSHYF